MTLGEIILKYRKERGISQNGFAAICTDVARAHGMNKGVSNGYVSMLENNMNPKSGKTIVPSFQTYLICAEAMGMTFDELQKMLNSDTPISTVPLDVQVSAFEKEFEKQKLIKLDKMTQLMSRLSPDDLELVNKLIESLVSK